MASKRFIIIAVAIVVCALAGFAWFASRPEAPASAPTIAGGVPNDPEVRRVTKADEALQAAARTAVARLPSFVEKLQSRRPGQEFAIRGRFETEVGPEYLWIRDPVYSEGSFTGTLDQQPMALDMKVGEQVTVTDANVFDWMIKQDGKIEGGFTEKALQPK